LGRVLRLAVSEWCNESIIRISAVRSAGIIGDEWPTRECGCFRR